MLVCFHINLEANYLQGIIMPGHGNHWSAIYGDEADIQAVIVRGCEDSKLVDQYPCIDVENETDRTEVVACLRYGDGKIVEDILVVSDSIKQEKVLFSGYPIVLDGIRHSVKVKSIEPWQYGIEGWLHVAVTTDEISLAFFDTRFYTGSAEIQPGETIDVMLAGVAYYLEPLQQNSIEINEGPLWEMEKQRRLDEGESPEDATKPVKIILSGMSAFLPRGGEECDDAEFGGVIDHIECFQHSGINFYRLEIIVLRPSDEEFRLPIFVSELVLDGYVPRLGEDVRGVMWIQGYVMGRSGNDPKQT